MDGRRLNKNLGYESWVVLMRKKVCERSADLDVPLSVV